MAGLDREILVRLGGGESIESVCRDRRWTREEFDQRWTSELASRVPASSGRYRLDVQGTVEIDRDGWGIPHIVAKEDADLWLGFGFAMAQDRLFQLDYLRRKGWGRLAEILGPEGVPSDLTARTVGLNRIARAEWLRLPTETVERIEAFTRGVNACIERSAARLPIEFDLLDYRPEPWSAVDCLAIENEFRWYLTGRFPVIVIPELAKRVLGDGALYREFLLGEEDGEAIIPPPAYQGLRPSDGKSPFQELAVRPREDVGQATGDPERSGSNNWVVAGRYCRSGKPMVASDPHIAFEAVSCWYEAHLTSDRGNVAGMAYVGMPAILVGRNEQVAWGITNNICSQRDLYLEKTDPRQPGCFLFGEKWEPGRECVETIGVKGREPLTRTIRFSRNGPVVNEILPPGLESETVTLKWLGAYQGGWLTSLLQMERARSVAEFREALRPWHVPTFNLVVADTAGNIAVQCVGRIPLRSRPERGCRKGWDPEQQWVGLLPFESLPHAVNPERGWLATANNRLAADDYPYPLFGTWPAGYRAARIRQCIEAEIEQQANRSVNDRAASGFAADDFRRIQHDTMSLRGQACRASLLTVLDSSDVGPIDPGGKITVAAAATFLRRWDFRVECDSVAATLFNSFFSNWCQAVVAARFPSPLVELVSRQADGIACRLLVADDSQWFGEGERVSTIRRVFRDTLRQLCQKLGPEMSGWQWGQVHQLPLWHVLSGRGDLGALLNAGGGAVKGDSQTVCNTGGAGPDWRANLGCGYRMIADLAHHGLLAVDAQSQSGHAGSPHYSDQFLPWAHGEYHEISLARPTSPSSRTELVAE